MEVRMKMPTLILVAAVAAFSVAASAAQPDAGPKVLHKTHHAKHAKARTGNPYAALEPYRSMDFIGSYPGDYARTRASGTCAIDLGYGRWVPCDVGGGGGSFH
jgi:hypothetical protein